MIACKPYTRSVAFKTETRNHFDRNLISIHQIPHISRSDSLNSRVEEAFWEMNGKVDGM